MSHEEESRKIRDYKNRDKAEEALERQKIRNNRKAVDQLKELDRRLGTGIGATKERSRLNKMLEKERE